MEIALYQPDQPPNTGTLLRLGACLRVPVHIIEPCGFPFSKRALQRYAMDYADLVDLHHHVDWNAFDAWRRNNARRLVLLTTKASNSYCDFTFKENDILLVGSESSGVPEMVHNIVEARLGIPMSSEVRSLNVAVSAAMVVGEALRQTGGWPKD